MNAITPTLPAAPEANTREGVPTDREAIVAAVARAARARYRDAPVAPPVIDQLAREAVDALWPDGVRVTGYIVILATRAVRERVEALLEPPGGPEST